jgi:SSS family solute:Na+ symporter
MIESISTIDLAVAVLLLLFLLVVSLYSSFHKKSSEEYFMADRSLKWYSVAGSIFGTNIHAQQIIGMMGIGYSIGFAQSHYEILAIPAILILVYVFIPIYRKKKFFTLSQFLEDRFNANARLVYTILMLAFIVAQVVADFYIGSRMLGLLFYGKDTNLIYLQGIVIIATLTIVFTTLGGMSSVVIADNILTIIMVIAVLLMGSLTYLQPEIGGIGGLLKLDHAQANMMHLYLPANDRSLPWPGIFTGLFIIHFFYWTTNQYQVQRVLAAKTERDAKLGSIVAGMLKLIIPFFSIGAGTAAFYLFNARYGQNAVKPDDTFLMLLKTVVPSGYGLTGLILAGMICAIFSAVYSMMNSVSTMMAYDVYRKYINKHASDRATVRVGQLSVLLVCALASLLAYTTYDPSSSDNFFLILANQASYIKPGLVVVFFWGIFWRKTNAIAAVIVLIASPFLGFFFDFAYNSILTNYAAISQLFGASLNFLYRIFLIFLFGSVLLVILSNCLNRRGGEQKENGLFASFSGVKNALLRSAAIHLPLILLVVFHTITAQVAALPAALLTFGLFIWYLNRYGDVRRFYASDIFYAGLLTSGMFWILYYFA